MPPFALNHASPQTRMTSNELTKAVRAGFEKLCVEFTAQVAAFGFSRTRKTFWTRPQAFTVEFLHFHRGGISYGAPINASVDVRIHMAIRVLNDDFEAAALNGPSSSDFTAHRPPYHLRFNARSFSQYDRCLSDAVRLVQEQALPWFARFSTPEALLQLDSPLSPKTRERLQIGLTGGDPDLIAASRKLLGIRS